MLHLTQASQERGTEVVVGHHFLFHFKPQVTGELWRRRALWQSFWTNKHLELRRANTHFKKILLQSCFAQTRSEASMLTSLQYKLKQLPL